MSPWLGSPGRGAGVGVGQLQSEGSGLVKVLIGLAIAIPVVTLAVGIATRRPPIDVSASADESLLLDMDELVHAARCAWIVNGTAPASLQEIANALDNGPLPFGANPCTSHNALMHAPMPGRMGSEMVRAINQRIASLPTLKPELTRIDDRQIQLCGEFETASDGQRNVTVAFDAVMTLDTPILTGPHGAGRECFTIDVSLPYPLEELRDASRLAMLDAIASGAECSLTYGPLPATLREIGDTIIDLGRDPDPRLCDVRSSHLHPTTSTDVTYTPLSPSSIELCTTFESAGPPSEALLVDFNIDERVHFAELMADRPAPGRHCYAIALKHDAADSELAPLWDEPVRIESLPDELQADARKDKRAIGDAINLIRLARCAALIDGVAPASIEAAIATTEEHSALARRHGCDWAPTYFAGLESGLGATYARMDDTTVRICADFLRPWPQPLRLDYQGVITLSWPGNLPALHQPVEPGGTCYKVNVSF
jgi:hypothetical protein